MSHPILRLVDPAYRSWQRFRAGTDTYDGKAVRCPGRPRMSAADPGLERATSNGGAEHGRASDLHGHGHRSQDRAEYRQWPSCNGSVSGNHANLVPEGIDGFIDAFGIRRIGEVRLADNLEDKEVHLRPGEGNIDFASLFTRLESASYQGHYMMAFGDQSDKLEARDFFATCISGGSGS
jgi:hypothetical protein